MGKCCRYHPRCDSCFEMGPGPPVRIFMRCTFLPSGLSWVCVLLAGCASTSHNTPVAVAVSPTAASVVVTETQQFTAAVNGSPSMAVNWEVNGVAGGNQSVGFISTSGLYVAPSGVPTKSDGKGVSVTTTVTLTAVSQANSA